MLNETDPNSGVNDVLKGLRTITVTTTLAVERMLKEAGANPKGRKQVFQDYLDYFRHKKADPWIYEPAILDNYGVFDEFARSVTTKHNFEGEQNTVAHMENTHMVGSLLADPEHGSMLLWPGYSGYDWAKDCKNWDEFAEKSVTTDAKGIPKLKKGGIIESRLWLAYSMLRNYYNPEVNPNFDMLFPQWREASLLLDGMLLGRNSHRKIDEQRLRGRSFYLDRILPYVPDPQKRTEIQSIINSNPSLIQKNGR